MRLELQVATAFALDLLLGDPRWFPHPVKFIGRFAMALEAPARCRFVSPRIAGIVTALTVVATTALAAMVLVNAAYTLHPLVGDAVSIVLLYTTFAARDLADHARAVAHELTHGTIESSRAMVARMVGRDTASLDERGIARAAMESVAENTVDGVTAPLFFALLGGPIGALAYKAVSTLDSTFGYKNERYIYFGWASARLDDVAAFVPARLTLPLISLAAALLRMRPIAALRCGLRDARKHASPNSGWAEAASAGALGVQFGGPLMRRGAVMQMPLFGDNIVPIDRHQIARGVVLMLTTSTLALLIFGGVRYVFVR